MYIQLKQIKGVNKRWRPWLMSGAEDRKNKRSLYQINKETLKQQQTIFKNTDKGKDALLALGFVILNDHAGTVIKKEDVKPGDKV